MTWPRCTGLAGGGKMTFSGGRSPCSCDRCQATLILTPSDLY